ncbi:TagF domain-containing protein, partial [Enterobacter hormaechei]|uniref:TagF domain-containing protein n=1 Tax=Enterobacter hormaechei TaxID=158836 RepID=UPI0039C85834
MPRTASATRSSFPVSHAHNRKDSRMTNTPAMNRYSWYGKLPSAGDFLQRRFPDTLQRQWSHWFQVG